MFEFLMSRIRLNGVVHDTNPKLCESLIECVASSFEDRVLLYPTCEQWQCLFKTMPSQYEPSESQVPAMSKILRRKPTLVECSEEFLIVHLTGP